MKQGFLSQYFQGVAVKRLSAVEADTIRSNQHEFNGVAGLCEILGKPDGKVRYPTSFIYLNDQQEDPVPEEGVLTWYDARQKARMERGVLRYEYRLYFPTNLVSLRAKEGDLLVIAKRPNDSLLAIVAEKDSTIAFQIAWLFGFPQLSDPSFQIRENLESEHDRIEFASRIVLESIGIAVEEAESSLLDGILAKFGATFPTTREFSAYAQFSLKDISLMDGPDTVLMAWMEREEILFRTLEKHIVSERLSKGFNDVDSFMSFSLSVQNRRKSRAGLALENHLERLFGEYSIKYTRTPITENRSKPDFLFPGQTEYRDPLFDPLDLTMLGVKSTCKDRWRQVLAEADRVAEKHLLTLEAAISPNQTDEMKSKKLTLVLPQRLHGTYSPDQQKDLINLSTFTELVRSRQNRAITRK
jgi:hypothetical protein